MKENHYILILLIFFSCSKNDGIITSNHINNTFVGEINLVRTYGGSKNDVAQSVVNTIDGGYAILGYTQSLDNDITDKQDESFDFWLVKFSSNDTIEWSKTFGGTNNDRGYDIIQTLDGGFAILGYTESNDGDVTLHADSQDFWLLKLDAIGNISWQKTFGYSGIDYGTTLLQTIDKGYLITGVLDVTASNGQGNSKTSKKHAGGDIWVIKLDNNGTLEWRKYYGGSFTDAPLGIVETDDNGYIIAASSDSNDVDISANKGTYDFWILKISSTGNLIWEKSFGGSEIDEARAITHSDDGNFIVVGDTRSSDKDVSSNKGAADLWILKISPQGDLIWNKSYGGSSFDVARSVFKTQGGGFLISGSSRSLDGDITINQGQNDAWILKTDSEGNLLWQTTLGGSEIDFFYDAVELNNTTIIAVGESNSSNGDILENKGFSDALVIKIN